MCRDNQDVMGEKPVKNDAGQLSLDEEAKKEAWREHYERLLNVEFPWNPEDLSEESPVEGPSEPITLEMITKAISKMASGKAAGLSGIVAEMLKPVERTAKTDQTDVSLGWRHMSFCWVCLALTHIWINKEKLSLNHHQMKIYQICLSSAVFT